MLNQRKKLKPIKPAYSNNPMYFSQQDMMNFMNMMAQFNQNMNQSNNLNKSVEKENRSDEEKKTRRN